MAVGNPTNSGGLNAQLGDAAVSLRDATALAEKVWGFIATLGPDQASQQAGLVALGFSSGDAAVFWTKANNLWAVYQLYHGQITQPAVFSYHDSLAAVRGAS